MTRMMNLEHSSTWLTILMALVFTGIQATAENPKADQPKCSGISRGKHFIVGFTENTNQYAHTRELSILVVAFSDQETTVTISSKHQTQGEPFQKTFVVEAGGFRKTIVPVELMMDGNERSFKSIDISASSDVSAYGLMYQDYTTDGFLGIPTNNLGKQYVVITQQSTRSSQFSVIGTKDSTSVLVTLRGAVTFEGQTYNAGEVLSFMVNKLEAVHIQGEGSQGLTGSIIQSDKAVAVFSGNICVNNPGSACDTLTEQLIPVKSWGQTHIYTAARSTDSNMYRIVAYFSATVVAIPGLANQTLDPGEFWEGSLSGSGLVSSSKPSLMMQQLAEINGITVDPSLIQVPAEEQFDFVFGFTTPPHSGGDSGGYFNFVSIIVKQSSRETVYLSDNPINATDVEDVPNTDYVSLTVELPKGEGVYFVEQTDPQGSPLSVIVYGYESAESYGYAAGLSLSSNEQLLSLTPYYLRELGGEVFSITVPCLETNSITLPDAKCRFSTGYGDVIVPGIRNGQYSLDCITPTFYKNGLTSVDVSLDDGKTFPYSGTVYVASERDYPPIVTVRQDLEDESAIVDVTSDELITLSWDPNSLGDGITRVNVLIQDGNYNSDGFPVLMDGITLRVNVLNNGYLTIHPDVILESLPSNGRPISVVAFYLTPSGLKIGEDLSGVFANEAGRLKRVYSSVNYNIKKDVSSPCSVFKEQLVDVAGGLNPCPCTSQQAAVDSLNFVESNFGLSFYHPGSESCYRSTTSSSTGSGQQCCYGADGNILLGPPGGGTADRYSPSDHFWKHQWYDVLPWIGCCKLSDDCDFYYKYRPSDDCSDYEPPRPGGGNGDPHITTLDGHKYTFNGAGEFLMASSILFNLTFQARMQKYQNTNASVYTSFVIQTNESASVQVQMSNENKTMILVDGEQLRIESSPIRVHHLKGVRISFNTDLSEGRLAFSAGVAVIVYIDPEVMSFIAQLDSKFQDQVSGLLGNLNGDPDDDLQFPNGTILETGSSLQDIHKLGMEWLVTKDSSIFKYISPYDYSSYHFPNFSPTFNVPDKNAVSQEIKDLCGESIDCLFDAVTTGSLSFANKTKEATDVISNIQKASVKVISCGFPGAVENGMMSGSVYLVNSTVEVTCDTGFTVQGVSSLTCQGGGRWSSDLPECRPSPTTEDGLPAYAIAIIVVGSSVTLVILILLFVWFLKGKNKVSHDE